MFTGMNGISNFRNAALLCLIYHLQMKPVIIILGEDFKSSLSVDYSNLSLGKSSSTVSLALLAPCCLLFRCFLFWAATLATISKAGLGLALLMDSEYNYDAKNERHPSTNDISGEKSSIIDGTCHPYTFLHYLSR